MDERRERSQLTPEQRRRVREAMQYVKPAYSSATVDFDRIAISTGILCIECKACGRRSMLTSDDCPQIRPGNRTLVCSAMFRCRCGSSEIRRYGACERDEAEMWLAGDPMDPIREIPNKAVRKT